MCAKKSHKHSTRKQGKKRSTRHSLKTQRIPSMLQIPSLRYKKHPLGMDRAKYARSVESILPYDKKGLWSLESTRVANNARPWSIYSYKMS